MKRSFFVLILVFLCLYQAIGALAEACGANAKVDTVDINVVSTNTQETNTTDAENLKTKEVSIEETDDEEVNSENTEFKKAGAEEDNPKTDTEKTDTEKTDTEKTDTEKIPTTEISNSVSAVQPSVMGAQEAFSEAKFLAKEARATYTGVSFSIDQPLWHRTLRYLDFALNAEPNNLEILRFAVETYTDLGWSSRAWFYWQRYLEAGGKRDKQLAAKVEQVATELGYSRYKSGDIQGAIEYYQGILDKDPNSSEAIVWLAQIYFEEGQPEKALPFWKKAAKNKLTESADYFLGRTQQQITYGVEASNAFHEGIILYEKDKVTEAQKKFTAAAQANTNFKDAWAWLGRSSLESQQPKFAEQAWRKVTELDPNDEGAKYFLQVSQTQIKWGIAAATAFQEGVTLYNQGSVNEANTRFVFAVNNSPNYLEAVKWAARTYQEVDDEHNAIRYWQMALDIDSDDEAAKYFLTTLLPASINSEESDTAQISNFDKGVESYKAADFKAAKDYFVLATEEKVDFSEAWGWLGRIHFEQGEYKQAIDYYNKALEFEPDNENFIFFAREAQKLANTTD